MAVKRVNVLFWFAAGGLAGASLALWYAPSSGEEMRYYLEMKSEIARVKTSELTDRTRDRVTLLLDSIKGQMPQ